MSGDCAKTCVQAHQSLRTTLERRVRCEAPGTKGRGGDNRSTKTRMLRRSNNRTGQSGRFAFSSTPEQPSVLPSKTASVVEDRIVDGQCARESRNRLYERRNAHKGHHDNARRPAAHSQKSGAFLAPDCARAKRPYSSLSKEVLLRKEKPEATRAAAKLWGEGSSGTSDWMLWVGESIYRVPSTKSTLTI